MMKKGTLLLVLVLSAALLAGCGKAKEKPSDAYEEMQSFDTEAEVTDEVAEKEEPAEEPVEEEPRERQIVDGKMKSYFTGQWIDAELAQQRPLAMMLNNTSVALPMSGVSDASVIYECPVEGRITRWMGIFEDWKDLERIGSVRSCRLYFLQFAQEFDAVYSHYGQAVYAVDTLNSGEFDVLSGATKWIEKPATAMFDRISRPGKATEHTLYSFPKGIVKDIEKKGYDMTMPEDYPGKFKFTRDGEISEYEGYPEATMLQPGGTGGKNGFGGVKATFKYDASDRKYY